MKIAALYTRVSTGNQEKEETIQSQLAEVKDRIVKDSAKEELILGDNLVFGDDGWSGDVLARPDLDKLRDAIKSRLFQVLYIYDLGRLSRNFLNQLILKKEIEDAGIKIVSLHDINNETPESGFAQNVMGLFHDYERIKIAERFRRGKLYKAREGILFGWNAPYGYKYIKGNKKDIKGSFEINKQEAEVVKIIFKWLVDEQMTIRQIIMRLFEQKILPRKNKKGYWSTSTLSRLFRDETYIGTTYYNKRVAMEPINPTKIDGYKKVKKSSRKNRLKNEWLSITVPSIIDLDTFEKAQQQLKRNSQFCMRNKVHEYLLSTLIKCSCGNTRAGEGINNHLYYRCSDRVNRFPLPKQCFSRGVNATILDKKVWKEIYKLLTEPKRIKEQYKKWNKKVNSIQEGNNSGEIIKLNKELEEQKELEERFVKAYGSKVISLEQLQSQLAEIKLKKNQIMSKLAAFNNNVLPASKPIILPDLKQFCDTIKSEIRKLNFKERQYTVRQIIDTVVTDGVTALVQGFLPLVALEENTQNNYGQSFINRYCRITKCRQEYAFQCSLKKTGGTSRQLSFLHNRAKRRCCRGA
jgi:site-specific DNA recombinase